MRSNHRLLAVIGVFLLSLQAWGQQEAATWKPVEAALGRSGKPQPDGAFKFSMPRKDLKVTVGGPTDPLGILESATQVKPGLALGAWAAFSGSADNAMLMGDLVLTEAEVEPVMLKLQEGGIEITALHNHLLGESPRVMYMHISGHGNGTKLGQVLHDALALTKTPPDSAPVATTQKIDLNTEQIDQALGAKGKDNNGIYQVSVPRTETIKQGGMEIPSSMGVATAINFQPTGGGKAAIAGDFVLLGSEVNPVIAALRQNGIEVVAVHSHMLNEEPRLFFMHFWANDDAVELARGIKAALDKTNSKR